MIKKVTLDPKSALESHQRSAAAAADDRFAVAAKITQGQPTGLAPMAVQAPQPVLAMGTTAAFDLAQCRVGSIVRVPLALIDLNPLSPRQMYKSDEVDKIAASLPAGQDVAAHGYVRAGRIQLIDGGTRYRAARISDSPFLDVKIEEEPASELALFERARALNEQRSSTTALDFALSLKTLLDRKILSSQDEIVEKVAGPDGASLTKGYVSMLLRITRLPERLRRVMNESEETSGFSTLYLLSGLFPDGLDKAKLEEATDMAQDVIDEIKRRKLSKKQIEALIKSKQSGPVTRERSASSTYNFGNAVGEFKAFASKRQVELTLKGVDPDDMVNIRGVLIAALEAHVRSKQSPPT